MNKKSLFIGRFQPFHGGHIAIIQKLLDEGKDVLIGLRDTPISENNPYTIDQRIGFIRKHFPTIEILIIPDIEEVVYGRDVGYKIREVRLSPELEAISATNIRKNL